MFYTHGQLDRADHLRKDQTQQTKLFKSKHAQVLPVWHGKLLVGDAIDGKPHMLSLPTNASSSNESDRIFLGLIDDNPVFALSISNIEETALDSWTSLAQASYSESNNIRFEDLRVLGPMLAANEGALMAYARGLIYWHDACQFCSRCGGQLHSSNAGHTKSCNTDSCQYQSFPRTDAAVIMLVTKAATPNSPAMSLLGRNQAWPQGVYSTLAGFVESGESLEQAVQREVFEEANITTEDVQYIASQPWPFPRSIMLGFEASAISTEITVDPDELEDAQWFTAEQLKTFGTWGEDSDEFKLPRTDSIARFLIDRWIAEHA